MPPSMSRPVKRALGHRFSRPERHHAQQHLARRATRNRHLDGPQRSSGPLEDHRAHSRWDARVRHILCSEPACQRAWGPVTAGLYFSHPSSLEHDPRAYSPAHPDTPERLRAIERALAGWDWGAWERREAPAASEAEPEL